MTLRIAISEHTLDRLGKRNEADRVHHLAFEDGSIISDATSAKDRQRIRAAVALLHIALREMDGLPSMPWDVFEKTAPEAAKAAWLDWRALEDAQNGKET